MMTYGFREALMIKETMLSAAGVITIFVSFVIFAFSQNGRSQLANISLLKMEMKKISWLSREETATKMFQYLSVSALFTVIVYVIDGGSLQFVSWFLG
jgi:preprotein translocase SecE subunit